MDCPSGWLRYAGAADNANVGPVMPGAAARAVAVSDATAISMGRSRLVFNNRFLILGFIVALLEGAGFGCGIHSAADVDLGHQSTEILRIVSQVIKIRRVQVERLSGHVLRIAGVQDQVQGLTTTQRYGIGEVVHV